MTKKTNSMPLVLLLAVSACAPAGETPAPVAATPVAAPAQALAAPPSPAATRWLADAPLRAGMARVRAATEALAHAEHQHLDQKQVLALADEVSSAVKWMFAECKLEPAPDAALHPLLARLLAASQALRDAPEDLAPLAELRAVLARYEQLFQESSP